MNRPVISCFVNRVNTSVSILYSLRSWSIVLKILCLLSAASPAPVFADVPITLYKSFAGNINVTATGATLRTQSNTVNACLVTNGPVTMPLSGIPGGSTIIAAYLYWAGSGSTIDSNVTFNGNGITADRTFTASIVIGGTTYNFFSGFKDVTSLVPGIGNYTFADLTVDTSATYCSVSAVLSGAALVVIYSNASEDFRVINAWDGFSIFYNSSISLIPTNFKIPTSPINGKHVVVTWEGDPDITGSENIRFNGTNLSDALNAAGSLWNSTINTIGSSTTYGVDVDVFDISSRLTAGATSATAVYSTGGDLVILSTQVMSVTNVPVADLSIAKSHTGNFAVGMNGAYTLTVTNNGPKNVAATDTITVSDTLPAGLTYVSGTGTGWTCNAVGQSVTCTRTGSLASGASLPLTLIVAVNATALPGVTNSASVSISAASALFDHILSNNTANDITTVQQPPNIIVLKSAQVLSDPVSGPTPTAKAIPGAVMQYTITVTNAGSGIADSDSIIITDPIPANTKMYVDTTGNAVTFSCSGCGLTWPGASAVTYSNVSGSGPFTYLPSGAGYDPNVKGVRIQPVGKLNGGGASFTVQFKVQVN